MRKNVKLVAVTVKLLIEMECLQIHFGSFCNEMLIKMGIYDLTTDVMHVSTTVLCKYGIIIK